jgi:hypothetical protein
MKTNIHILIISLLSLIIGNADTKVEKEIKQLIIEDKAYTSKNLQFKPDKISKEGSLEFWSSGGLLNTVPQDDKVNFDLFNLHAKHIKVIEINANTAVALYYQEGNVKPKGGEMNNHYLTRVMQVFVKEDGGWKIRAAHWSPLTGGKGTSQTALEE